MEKTVQCSGSDCGMPFTLIGDGDGEEIPQTVPCEHCGRMISVSWPKNGHPSVQSGETFRA
jgi:hypothetical protein